ncbi:hypothetical protein N7501_012083 [Penicillium viridicatum]|nr:hypothetical protein N7501_012083 [Penicillium viridicatum]
MADRTMEEDYQGKMEFPVSKILQDFPNSEQGVEMESRRVLASILTIHHEVLSPLAGSYLFQQPQTPT